MDGERVCVACADDQGLEKCTACGIYTDDVVDDECYDCRMSYCEDCGDEYYRDNLVDGLCEYCRQPCCQECGERFDGDYDEEYCDYCRDSGLARVGEGNPNYVHRFLSTAEEGTDSTLPFLGWELEVELEGAEPEAVTDWVDNVQWLEYKHDGSLDRGVEMASSPMTLGWVKENEAKIKALLKHLRNNGIESDETGTCGMHVHINRGAFVGDHAYRFISFVYRPSNKDFIFTVSGRHGESDFDRWASCKFDPTYDYTTGTYVEAPADFDAAVRAKADGLTSMGKYQAVNTGSGHGTYEVRIFKGTLNEERFFKNLELVTAMWEFTKTADEAERDYRVFVDWVAERSDRFANLASFLASKGYINVAATLAAAA